MFKVYKVFYKDALGKGHTTTVKGKYGTTVLVDRLTALGYNVSIRRVGAGKYQGKGYTMDKSTDKADSGMTYGQAVKVLTAALANSTDKAVMLAIQTVNSGHLRRASVNPVLTMLTSDGVGCTVHEDTIYAAHKSGRKDVYWIIADAIKLAADKSTRQWIDFDSKTGLYTYKGDGATPPKGYTGYVPKAER